MNRFKSFGALKRFLDEEELTTRGIPVRARLSSARPLRFPLESTSGKSQVQAVSLRSTKKGKDFTAAILWQLFFGKKFKVIHWQFLFELIDRTEKWEPITQVIFDALMIVNVTPSGGPFQSFDQNMKSVKSSLVDQTDLEDMLEVLKSYGINLPRKDPGWEFLTVNFSDTIHLNKPEEPVRIGVGYKDKGSLGLPGSEYDPTEISPMVGGSLDLFKKLLLRYKQKNYSFK